MIECPRCGTLYRRPARTELGADASYRCARCRHVFEAAADEPAMVAAADEEADDDAEQFAFEEERDDEVAPPPAKPARPAREPAPRAMSTARFAMRSMMLVTLGYAVLSVYLYTHPAATRQLLRGVPLIGDRLAGTRLRRRPSS
jgi:DNA-directed RNA polymerase subunit RPC12/RpoP